jgi:hypothetical protein
MDTERQRQSADITRYLRPKNCKVEIGKRVTRKKPIVTSDHPTLQLPQPLSAVGH